LTFPDLEEVKTAFNPCHIESVNGSGDIPFFMDQSACYVVNGDLHVFNAFSTDIEY